MKGNLYTLIFCKIIMIVKYSSARIVQASTSLKSLFMSKQGMIKSAAKKMAELEMYPDDNIYLRNRAVSALELHGPNQNSDAFEYDELREKAATFIGDDISVDHIGTTRIGTIIDSEFICVPDIRGELEIPHLPLKDTAAVLAEKCRKDSVFGHVLEYANANKLVRGSDRQLLVDAVAKSMCVGGWIENIWAVDKKLAEAHTQGLVQAILKNYVTDSSMGALVNAAVCSVCGNIATGELPEHDDFCDCIRLYKGQQIPVEGMWIVPFEINRDFYFFEDSLILPFQFGGKAGGEGADKDAKFLEVFSSKKKKMASSDAFMKLLHQLKGMNTADELDAWYVRLSKDEFEVDGLKQYWDALDDVEKSLMMQNIRRKEEKINVISGKRPKTAYMTPYTQAPINLGRTPDAYVMLGDEPENVTKNKKEFNQERIDFARESEEDGVGPGNYPEGTIISIEYEGDKVDAIVVEEKDDNTLIVAIDGIDEPIDVDVDAVGDIIEYPEEADYEKKMEIEDVHAYEMQPEQRAASKIGL